MYWDANNLYDWAMIQDLLGHILEVDLEYCKELHDSHSDYPVCSEKIEVSNDMLSKYCKDIADWYDIKFGGVKKLIPNLVIKSNILFITKILGITSHWESN